MRLLLDTHALLWYALSDRQLSETAKGLILAPTNSVLISPATFWEIAIKISIGKLTLQQPYEEFLDLCLKRRGFQLLPIQPAHTARVARLPFPPNHRDPFDRMLVAQALVENLHLVSSDQALDGYGVRRLW